MQDHYQTLNVKKTATADEIKKSFRRLAKEHHPDAGGDPEKFKAISEAYQILSNPDLKNNYDHNQNGNFYSSYDGWEETDFSYNHFNRVFRDFFGDNSHHHRIKNKDIQLTIEVPLASIVEQQTRIVEINTGRNKKTVTVTIPAGVHDKAVISYSGFGQDVLTQQPPGNLIVYIRVIPNKDFYRQGADLISEIAVDCLDAITGTKVEFCTIRNKKIKLTIPPGTQNSQILKISKHGLPNIENHQTGDQLVLVRLEVPKNLSNESIELIKKAKEISHDQK